MSSGDVYSWLCGYANLERGANAPPARAFRLDRMEILAALAGHPERCAPSIHIAGSKGKGSVTAMIASVLEEGGRRTARYMSPHISDFRERVCQGDSFFGEGVYCAAADELREVAEHKAPAVSLFDPSSGEGAALTFFELATLYFFLCARAGGCDFLVVETGMGGRLDCTNIVDPIASVITLVELEHTAFLGDTAAKVAGEKAGIIKPGKPLILARQGAEALEVFRARAGEAKSPLCYFPDHAAVENPLVHKGGTDFSVRFAGEPQALGLSIPLPGLVQAENAALAALALKTAFPGIKNEAIRGGLRKVRLPARFEQVAGEPPFIIDGAHTPESVRHCAETFCALYGGGGVLIFACAADKNIAAMAEILLPLFSRIIVTVPGAYRSSDPEKVRRAFASPRTAFIEDTPSAVRHALEAGRAGGLPVLGTGSFYLAAEIRKNIQSPA